MHAPVRWSLGTAAALAALVAVGALWFALAPTAIGGSADYAVVAGSSMEPLLARGDLAVLRARRDYRVGDVVAYHNRQLGRVVLHRIIAEEHGRYAFKGDNNTFVDTPQVGPDELIGELWFRVPNAGAAVVWLHRPAHAALAGAVIALVLLFPGIGSPARRRRQPAATSYRRSGATLRRSLVGIAALATALCSVGALYAWTHAPVRTVSVPGAYTSSGVFSYEAQTPGGAVYPSGTLAAGEPVFVRLVHRLQLSFAYRFRSPLAHETRGTAQLTTLLTSSLGWKRVVSVEQPRHFRGDVVRLTAALDLPRLEQLIATYLRTTGVPSDTFAVAVQPRVQLAGRIDGHALTQTFAPPLMFSLDPYSLRLAQAAPPTSPGASAANPLRPTMSGVLTRTDPAVVSPVGVRLRIASLRRTATIAAAASGLLALLAATVRPRFFAPRRRRDVIVTIREAPEGDPFDVPSFDKLHALAKAEQRLVLDAGDAFYVNGRTALYRYRPADAEQPTLELTPRLV
jgi:signal peptidase